jgi:hypothetical protein
MMIGSLWPPIQLRAVAEVLKVGINQNSNNRLLYQAWFNQCVVPALQEAHYHDIKAFSRQDI